MHEPQVNGPRLDRGREAHIVGVVDSSFRRKVHFSGIVDTFESGLVRRRPVRGLPLRRVPGVRAWRGKAATDLDALHR